MLQPFLKSPPSDPGLLFAWGSALVGTRQSELAAPIFRRLLEQNANDPNVRLLLGQAYGQQQDYPNALSEFNSALQLDASFPEAHYFIGLVHLRQNDFEHSANAVAILHKVVEVKPDDALARLALGRALLQQGMPLQPSRISEPPRSSTLTETPRIFT